MKLYRIPDGIVIEEREQFCLLKDEDWDKFVNDDNLSRKMQKIARSFSPTRNVPESLLPPIKSQEVWASGVTYLRSRLGREQESRKTGGGDYYARVYEAERPELFFKSTPHRVVGHGGKVRIRRDSTWNVPEPELTLMITSSGKIAGYTIGNDMSSRSIEGENPLYLPQAKVYDGCAAIGPSIYVSEDPLPANTTIELDIRRNDSSVFRGSTELSRLKRDLAQLVSFLYRECTFPNGSLLMTGTGIVPPNDFTLHSGDEIVVTIEPIGKLINRVE